MRQGAVGQVRLVERDGRSFVEKRMPDARRHDTEVFALRALAGSGLPVPELVTVEPGSILMTLMPGERLDSGSADERIELLAASAPLLRSLHELPVPDGLPSAPDDQAIIRRYREADGPPLPLAIPPSAGAVFSHGDWTDGNVLAVDGAITAIIDWEAAHLGDPLRELSRAAWGASLKDERSFDALIDAYGADREAARAWVPIHAAELWLWFAEAGPPEYLADLTERLRRWPD
ncbi:phosphotransferase family protein [Microbacterium sp. W4I20]|uniref:phosphotransferase family protein n=1 Tax=Microbacterium sp. W4I20 TaxID=3042262 RepID=UPI0027879C25|nr:phosphotransferase [Microbacterium sp. W4I20]MDQ0727925.1 aminoglycoside phosphotransferase (APT) family kinase protein [Microbacterium sp. W4I20]